MTSTPASTTIAMDLSFPQPLTPLVGRIWEVASAGALLRDPQVRLLTLTGPAGVGKTRLALRIAEQALPEFGHGAVFVSLAALNDPEMVLPAIGNALGIRIQDDLDLFTRLGLFLSDRELLLVLDNFEQVSDAAMTIAALLHRANRLKILVTSRVSLGLSNEQEFAVGPLPLPVGGSRATAAGVSASDAVALFLQRARAVRPDFELTNDLAAPVAEICRRLDGLPLAIELAASRTKMFSPVALLARLSDRMHILTDGPRDAPHRQQTMRSAIAWSYELLDEEERRLFRRLGVFAGGFGIEAAAAVCGNGDVFNGIASLVDKSLLTRTESSSGDARLGMLETIREFALDELVRQGEQDDAYRRLANWLDELVFASRKIWASRSNVLPWLDRFDEEIDNIRAALDWYQSAGEWNGALRVCAGVAWYWDFRGLLREGRARVEQALEHATDALVADRAWASFGAALLAHSQGADDPATFWATEAQRLGHESNEQWIMIASAALLGIIAEDNGRFEDGERLLQSTLALSRELGNVAGEETALNHLGVVSWGRGKTEQALEYWRQALVIQREIGDLWSAAVALSYLGLAACERGDLATATAMNQESLTYFWEFRNAEDMAYQLSNMAMVLVLAGRPERAVRLFGAAESARAVVGSPIKEPERSIFLRYIERCRKALGAETFEAAWRSGNALTLEDAVSEAMAPVETAREETPNTFDLTARELEVLQLLAEGKSDRDIGENLYISARTVQTHVGHVLGKLGVTSRTAAAALAHREGLIGREF